MKRVGKFAWRHKGKILLVGGVGTLTAVSFHEGFRTHSRLAHYDALGRQNKKFWEKMNRKMNKDINQGINRIIAENEKRR